MNLIIKKNRNIVRKNRLIGKIVCLGIIGILLFGGYRKQDFVQAIDFLLNQEKEPDRMEYREEEVSLKMEDSDFYRNSIQNLYKGNSIVYADGYFYFRSQVNYSLCRLKETGGEVEELVEQMPAEICIHNNLIYFINASDGQTLYSMKMDGENLTKLGDFPMQNMIITEDKIYFLAFYDREQDPLREERDHRYLYSVNLDGSDRELLVSKRCKEFTMDETQFYYLVDRVLYKSKLDGTEEEVCSDGYQVYGIVPYQGQLYGNLLEDREWKFVRWDGQNQWECQKEGKFGFVLSEGKAYLYGEGENGKKGIWCLDLETGEEKNYMVLGWEQKNIEFTENKTESSNAFLINGTMIFRYWESKEKGILWHIWKEEYKKVEILEDMEPRNLEELVRDSSFYHENLITVLGQEDPNVQQYITDEIKRVDYEHINGKKYGKFELSLPRFGEEIQGYETINRVIEGVEAFSLRKREYFFRILNEMSKSGCTGACAEWEWSHQYKGLYVGERYLSFFCYYIGFIGGTKGDSGLRWDGFPLAFDRETGDILSLDDLFLVDRNIYMKRLSSVMYKYCELVKGRDIWEDFNENSLVKNFKINNFYFTEEGIVLWYKRHAVWELGSDTWFAFEIPYKWFEDIYRKETERTFDNKDRDFSVETWNKQYQGREFFYNDRDEFIEKEREENPIKKEKTDTKKTDAIEAIKGNSIAYADGYYYFRSQAKEYSLCRSKGLGEEAEMLANQMPTEILVWDHTIYFINASDGLSLYCMETDGSHQRKLVNVPMQSITLYNKKLYFLADYGLNREYSEQTEKNHYLYSVNLDGSDLRLLISRACDEFTIDGTKLYYTSYDGSYLYQNILDGTKEQLIWRGDGLFGIMVYQGQLYGNLLYERHWNFSRWEEEGWNMLGNRGRYVFGFFEGDAYLYGEEEIYCMNLETEKEEELAKLKNKQKILLFLSKNQNQGIFLVNHQIFFRYWESEDKGILWHIWEEKSKEFQIFEDRIPIDKKELVLDDSIKYVEDFYTPGRVRKEDRQYIIGELNRRRYGMVEKKGVKYKKFICVLPWFGTEIAGREKIHMVIEEWYRLAVLEELEFSKNIASKPENYLVKQEKRYQYQNLYVGEHYLSFLYIYRYVWEERKEYEVIPITFNRETGERIGMDDLFLVERDIYLKRLASAIYQYQEMIEAKENWNGGFDQNDLVRKFDIENFYLTPDGIVLWYKEGEIDNGYRAFEIPYNWIADIYIGE